MCGRGGGGEGGGGGEEGEGGGEYSYWIKRYIR